MSDTIFDDMPRGLKEYLSEQMEEGLEIAFSHTETGTFFIMINPGFDKWLILIEWKPSQEPKETDWGMINVCHSAWDVLYKKMADENKNNDVF